MWALDWIKRWRKRGGDHVSPLGSLEAAAMKLSAAVCNLSSYTASNGWAGGGERGGGGGRRQKYLAPDVPVNCVLWGIILKFLISNSAPFLTLLDNSDALKIHLCAQLCIFQSRCLATVIQLFVKLLYNGTNLRIQNFFQLFLIAFTLKRDTNHTSIFQLPHYTCYHCCLHLMSFWNTII